MTPCVPTREERAATIPDVYKRQAQYASLRLLLDDILYRYPAIRRDRSHILGHEEYNPSKNDPGALFSWERIGVE